MKTSLIRTGFAALALSVPMLAHAGYDVLAKVMKLEPSYMPDAILFTLDVAISTCPAGTWVYYYGTAYGPTDPKKNNQAAYAGLLYALATKTRVEVHAEVAGCIVTNIHPTNQ